MFHGHQFPTHPLLCLRIVAVLGHVSKSHSGKPFVFAVGKKQKKTRKATQNLRSKTTCALKQHDEETVPAAQQRDMGMAVQQTAQAQTMAYQRRVPDFQKETYLTRAPE